MTYKLRESSGRDPRLHGKVTQSTTICFQNIVKFVNETSKTFVTWNRNIKLWALIKTVITLYPKRQNKDINERNV